MSFLSQPVKLVVTNAISTTGATLAYTFEVATDAAFTAKVQTKAGVTQGTNGQTTAALDALGAGKYYWHARADSGSTIGGFGPTLSFTVGAAVSLSAPLAISPGNGTSVLQTPTLTVGNSTKTGPADQITYRFDVSDSASFSTIVASGTVNEGASQTSYVVSPALAVGRTYYWQATAIDSSNGATSLPSAVQSFIAIVSAQAQIAAEEGLTLWPATQPPGTNGHTTLGANWDIKTKIVFGTSTPYLSPQLEALRLIDLVDRGLTPGDAIVWMKQNNYPTIAVYYSGVEVFGIDYQYIADVDPGNGRPSTNGVWNLVDRLE